MIDTMTELRRAAQYDLLKQADLNFLAAIKHGVCPLTAFRESDPRREQGDERMMLARVRHIQRRFPEIAKDVLGSDYRQNLKAVALLKTRKLLASKDERSIDAGIKHARAICGMDEPTRQNVQIESPHLDKRPLVPASERFMGEN